MLVEALREVLLSCARRALPVMLLKGLSLSERLYEVPCERFQSDIDLLVATQDMEVTGAELEHLGYRPVRKDRYAAQHFHIPYVRGTGANAVTVELHWDVVKPGSEIRFAVDRWWEKAKPAKLRSGEVLVPPPDEELPYLSHHAFLEGAITLKVAQDIARWIARHDKKADWDRIAEVAKSSGAEHFLRRAIRMTADLWGVESANALVACRGGSSWRMWIARNPCHRKTIISVGRRLWWPMRVISYWSMLGGESGAPRGLVKRALRDPEFLRKERVSLKVGSVVSRLGALSLALLLCLLPSKVFPAKFRADRDLA